MIINNANKIFFVHIPKCGGTSIRNLLSPVADSYMSEEEMLIYRKIHLDIPHWPLFLIEQHAYHIYQKILDYDTYAVVRDPYDRFISSVSQRMAMFYKKQLRDMNEKEINESLDSVISYLETNSGVNALLKPEFIHFQRQTDYIFNHETQIVKHVFPIERIDKLKEVLQQKVGDELINNEFKHLNKTSTYKNKHWRLFSKLIMSNKLYKLIPKTTRDAFNNKYVLKKYNPQTIDHLNSNYIKDFITEYYHTDIDFYNSIK